ncbi:MAG: PQQ-dependent sugar dehydrogenase, partial [Anaerolineales bacterium]
GPEGMVDPVAEYSHAEGGCSVTGGYVYRGSMPEWNGIYLYGDYCSGLIWGLIRSDGNWQSQLLFDMDVTITSFGQDESGELYLVSDNGGIYRLERIQ